MISKIKNQNKILWSTFFFLWTIILAYSYLKEPNIERFEGTFIGYIEMYLNGHIQLNNFQLMPLFESHISADQSLPLRTENIVASESYWPCFVSLFLILHYISGISPQLLVILPLGLLFIPFMCISIIRSFDLHQNNRSIYFSIIILYLIFLSTTRYYGSFYVAPPAIMLFLTIFFSIKKYFDDSNLGRRYILISLLCTLSLSHYWHTPTMWILYLVISLCVVTCSFYVCHSLLKNYVTFSNANITFKNSIYTLVSIAIIILTFFHLWQSQYLNLFANTADIDFLSLLAQKLFTKNPFPVPYAYNYKDLFFGQIYYFAYLLTLVLSSVMIIVPILFLFSRSKAERRFDVNLSVIFIVSVIITQILATISYFKSNSIGFPLVPLLLPLLSIWLFSDLDRKYCILNQPNFRLFLRFVIIILIILNIICALCLLLTNQAGANSETKYKDTGECFSWLYCNASRDKDVVVDFNILGLFLQHEAKTSEINTSYVDLSPPIYHIIVGDNHNISPILKENYVVIDQATMIKGLPIHTTSARAMLIPEWNRINHCVSLDKLYADSHLSVFRLK